MTNRPRRSFSPAPFAIAGLVTIILTFGLVGGWAVTAPLASAVVAPASVAVESHRKVIQHFEGGIVEHIYVKEAQRVSQGDILVALKTVEAIANLTILRERLLVATATEARLEAEQLNKDEIIFPATVQAAKDRDILKAIQGQMDLFDDRRSVYRSQTRILERRLDQVDRQI